MPDPVVTIDELRVQFGLPSDGAWVRRLEIERPVISLHIDEDGLREFREAKTSRQQRDLPWSTIEINNARLEIDAPVGSLLLEGRKRRRFESC